MSENKKIINARTVEYAGIEFRSISERNMYKKLVSLGITPEYEPETFTLLDTFRPNKEWYQDGIPMNTKKKDIITGKMTVITDKPASISVWQYTPDFRIKMGDFTFFVEVKGFPNDLWPYKRKMFLRLLQDLPNTFFFEVHNIKGLLNSVEVMKRIYENSTTKNN